MPKLIKCDPEHSSIASSYSRNKVYLRKKLAYLGYRKIEIVPDTPSVVAARSQKFEHFGVKRLAHGDRRLCSFGGFSRRRRQVGGNDRKWI